MKKIILILAITLLVGKLYADGGRCVRYQIGITLINGDYIVGFVYENSYEPKFEFNDVSIKDFIIKKSINKGNKLTIYLNVKELIFPKLPNYRNDCDFHLNATSIENVKEIDTNDIQEIKLIEFNLCHNCGKYDLNDGFYWAGIYPNVITELTNNEIELLQTNPISTNAFSFPIDEYSVYKVISYNNAFDTAMLKKLCDDFLQSLENDFEKNNWEIINKKYSLFKQESRAKNIIIFKIGFSD